MGRSFAGLEIHGLAKVQLSILAKASRCHWSMQERVTSSVAMPSSNLSGREALGLSANDGMISDSPFNTVVSHHLPPSFLMLHLEQILNRFQLVSDKFGIAL